VYKDKEQIIASLRKAYPPFKETREFQFAFKIRDRSDPKSWFVAKDLMDIPPESELEKTPAENVKVGAAAGLCRGDGQQVGGNVSQCMRLCGLEWLSNKLTAPRLCCCLDPGWLAGQRLLTLLLLTQSADPVLLWMLVLQDFFGNAFAGFGGKK
jgi:hypothetical protein